MENSVEKGCSCKYVSFLQGPTEMPLQYGHGISMSHLHKVNHTRVNCEGCPFERSIHSFFNPQSYVLYERMTINDRNLSKVKIK